MWMKRFGKKCETIHFYDKFRTFSCASIYAINGKMARWAKKNVMCALLARWNFAVIGRQQQHRTNFNMHIQWWTLVVARITMPLLLPCCRLLVCIHLFHVIEHNFYIVNFRIAKSYSIWCYWRQSSISERSQYVPCLPLLLRRFIGR